MVAINTLIKTFYMYLLLMSDMTKWCGVPKPPRGEEANIRYIDVSVQSYIYIHTYMYIHNLIVSNYPILR